LAAHLPPAGQRHSLSPNCRGSSSHKSWHAARLLQTCERSPLVSTTAFSVNQGWVLKCTTTQTRNAATVSIAHTGEQFLLTIWSAKPNPILISIEVGSKSGGNDVF
jgi:hypothetical protein